MKFYVYVFLCALSSMAMAMTKEESAQFVKTIIESCGKELSSKPEDITAVVNDEKVMSDSAKCIVACAMKKFKLIGDDNTISVEGAKQMATQMAPNNVDVAVKVAEEIAHKCIAAQTAGDSACEAAYKYSECTTKGWEAHTPV